MPAERLTKNQTLMLQWIRKNTALFLMASLTLGLSPFFPEPHIVGKLRWILGGANGMELMDWLDFIMHGTPWLLLLVSLVLRLDSRKSESKKTTEGNLKRVK